MLFACGCAENKLQINQDGNQLDGPVFKLGQKGFICNWLVVGAFPNPPVENALPDGSYHLGFYKDYLKSIGGEEKAVLKSDTSVVFTDEDGREQTLKTQTAKAGGDGVINLDEIFKKADNKAAYAFCYISCEKAQKVHFLFGSDDSAKVWINGELVHKIYAGRALQHGQDSFNARLDKGLNRVLVKVTEQVRDWGFVVEALDEAAYTKIQAEKLQQEQFKEFLDCRVVSKVGNSWDYTFGPGKFPEVDWEKPYLVEKVLGKFPLKVRWFDGQLNEVTTPKNPGRYAFVAEGTSPKSVHIRRAATLYCRPNDWFGWSETPKANLSWLNNGDIDRAAWDEHEDAISSYAGKIVHLSILGQREGAVLMSYLHEIEPTGKTPALTDTPAIRDDDYHLALKLKLLGVEDKWPLLKMPRRIEGEPATVLHEGNSQAASVKLDTADKIRAVCQQWYAESDEPFVICIARHGIIIIHEAFGPDDEVTIDTATPMASLTKLVTGVMFAQFVDQGLIEIDDPVGKFLPDFPVKGDKAITLRHCFTHTTGLYGHAEWRGLHNPYLENTIANYLEYLTPGKVYSYNGMGYNLAGRVMEVVSGKSIFRLMRENFFDPLDAKNTFLEEDLGFSCNGTAYDFAVIGQLLLNEGSYGDLKFFSPATFDKLLPKHLKQFYPDINVVWGIGLTWMRQGHPDAGKNGLPKDKTILSKNIIGHGSATSAILRVDLDNNLVIAQTRRRGSKAYDKYLAKFLMAIENGLTD
jgi:CubicO group peptidase (beta-lactamase class C family)